MIERLTAKAKTVNQSTVKGIGDDAAIIDSGGDYTVVSTDLLLEGIHFDLTYVPLKHLGYKSVVVNLSDIYAMNATPTHITIALGISKRFSVEDLELLYQGVYLACERYGVDLVGGDTTTSLTGLTIGVTALGHAKGENITLRKGANPNDLVCVTGNLGAAYLGLQVLEREKKVYLESRHEQPALEGFEYVLERYLKPEAGKGLIESLGAKNIKPSSMIDVSDGLSSEMLHICKSSSVGCRIYLDKIPIAGDTHRVAGELNMDTLTVALNGGEDYELLFTAPLALHKELKKLNGVSIIGHITPEEAGPYLVTPSGQEVLITAQGWNAIRKE